MHFLKTKTTLLFVSSLILEFFVVYIFFSVQLLEMSWAQSRPRPDTGSGSIFIQVFSFKFIFPETGKSYLSVEKIEGNSFHLKLRTFSFSNHYMAIVIKMAELKSCLF